jgi:hypothetical protein
MMPLDKRTPLANSFLSKSLEEKRGHHPRYYRDEYTAYGQAVIGFVREVYSLCQQHNVKVLASIVSCNAPRSQKDFLRKDYAYLFERFYYFLEDTASVDNMGLLIFDERDKNFCKRLCIQMETYYGQTDRGQVRSSRIVPQPFFVHSDITTAVQVADIVAYSLNWGLRFKKMKKPTRHEMEEFGQLALSLQYIGIRDENTVYGIKYIDDLRPRLERNASP